MKLPKEVYGLAVSFPVPDGDWQSAHGDPSYDDLWSLRYDQFVERVNQSPWAKQAVDDLKGFGMMEGADGAMFVLLHDKLPKNLTVSKAVSMLKSMYYAEVVLPDRDDDEDDDTPRTVPTYGRCFCGGEGNGEYGPPHHVEPRSVRDVGNGYWKCDLCTYWFEPYPPPKTTDAEPRKDGAT